MIDIFSDSSNATQELTDQHPDIIHYQQSSICSNLIIIVVGALRNDPRHTDGRTLLTQRQQIIALLNFDEWLHSHLLHVVAASLVSLSSLRCRCRRCAAAKDVPGDEPRPNRSRHGKARKESHGRQVSSVYTSFKTGLFERLFLLPRVTGTPAVSMKNR